MPPFLRRYLPLSCLLAVVLIVGTVSLFRKKVPEPPPVAADEPSTLPQQTLSALAAPPDWKLLDPYQKSITRSDFERLLTTIFTVGEGWRNFIDIDDTRAVIQTNLPGSGETYTLEFATSEAPRSAPKTWKSTAQQPPAPADKPLEGLHIAIDAGHIGGAWAKMEERWFIFNGGKPVTEGDMTLLVAQLLKPRLEALGAKISLVREKPEPVTPIRPGALISTAENASPATQNPESIQKLAERLFYRTAEIHARAEIVNQTIQPDLVLCLHFNAEGWGDPSNPMLVTRTHLHLLLNGAYNDSEIALNDQRFTLIHKILQRTHEEEAFVGATVADTFAEISKLPAYQYPPNAPNVRSVNGHPYLWARNLLANRLYDCPVIFMEPYVMNSTIDYDRIQAGDYDGMRQVDGEMKPSIFREYADALTEGLRRHYATHRPQTN